MALHANYSISSVQFSSAHDRPSGRRAFAEVFPVPTFRDVGLRHSWGIWSSQDRQLVPQPTNDEQAS